MSNKVKYTNIHNIDIGLAVWLATDNYTTDTNSISATTIIKPIKQIILSSRVDKEGGEIPDITSLAASRLGTAVHESIENAWVLSKSKALAALGYPAKLIDRIVVNPDAEYLETHPDCLPVYMEKRSSKNIGNTKISGKFDFVIHGSVKDVKTASTFTYTSGSNTDNYKLQGSIYRWLNQDIITDDIMEIYYVFKDWSKAKAAQGGDYPPHPVMTVKINLLSVEETENYITNKLEQLNTLFLADESELPLCTPEDLWQTAPMYKYYKNPDKLARSTKNFKSLIEANTYMAHTQAGAGVVITVESKAKRCSYCDASSICSQYATLKSRNMV